MKVAYQSGMFLADGAPDPAVMQASGWRWNKMRCCWYSSKIERAAKFRHACVGEAKQRVDSYVDKRAAAIAASHALTSNIEVPSPDGLTYRPYQLAGIEFMLSRKDSLNADSMRLGKTIQALGVMNATNLKSALIICPASVKLNWEREFKTWNVHDGLEVGVCEGKSNPKSPVLVCNYDILQNHTEYLKERTWDVLVCDEAHYLKGGKSRRTIGVLGRKSRTKADCRPPIPALRRMFLTGTPLYTRPIDMWSLIEACDPAGLGANWLRFTQVYCAAFQAAFGYDTSGASNLEELQFQLRSRFMIRREKEDVCNVIPSNRQTIVFPQSGLEALVKKEQNFVRANLERFEQMLNSKLDDAGIDQLLAEYGYLDGVERDEVIGQFSNTYVHSAAELATVRKDLAIAKCPMVGAFLEDLLESEPKVVVFAHHRAVVEKLKDMFPEAAVVYGGLTVAKRDSEVRRFQHDPACRLFIGNIISAGQGIALSAADVVVFAEMSWVPSEMDQAEERVWDVMKDRPISAYRLVVADSLDARMCDVIERRQRDIAKALRVSTLGVV